MRCLGEFVGHVVHGVRAKPRDPSVCADGVSRQEVRREETSERRGDVTLRRTVVEEIEYRDESSN